jgi:outer membrane protein assembly factor BamE (lipoprotein component of BamABCDE complex)
LLSILIEKKSEYKSKKLQQGNLIEKIAAQQLRITQIRNQLEHEMGREIVVMEESSKFVEEIKVNKELIK